MRRPGGLPATWPLFSSRSQRHAPTNHATVPCPGAVASAAAGLRQRSWREEPQCYAQVLVGFNTSGHGGHRVRCGGVGQEDADVSTRQPSVDVSFGRQAIVRVEPTDNSGVSITVGDDEASKASRSWSKVGSGRVARVFFLDRPSVQQFFPSVRLRTKI